MKLVRTHEQNLNITTTNTSIVYNYVKNHKYYYGRKNKEDLMVIEDHELDDITAGAALADYTDEEYNEAGVEVIGPGEFQNQGYRLMASGENFSSRQAYYAVSFYRVTGRQAKKLG